MILAAVLLVPVRPAASLPQPGLSDGDQGWRFASCAMESVCQGGECRPLPIPGQTYLWRDADGVRIGTSESAAVDIAAYNSADDARSDLAEGVDWPSPEVLVTPPEEEGPGWMRVVLYRLIGDRLSPRTFRLSCETADEAPQ
ncbi:hypothetical protein HKCCE3408_04805 [Rhodobacterales bacterium HKCCE3408]|nr:hypothetical protein [Rhodobacterales bacterium HKCCE3408]